MTSEKSIPSLGFASIVYNKPLNSENPYHFWTRVSIKGSSSSGTKAVTISCPESPEQNMKSVGAGVSLFILFSLAALWNTGECLSDVFLLPTQSGVLGENSGATSTYYLRMKDGGQQKETELVVFYYLFILLLSPPCKKQIALCHLHPPSTQKKTPWHFLLLLTENIIPGATTIILSSSIVLFKRCRWPLRSMSICRILECSWFLLSNLLLPALLYFHTQEIPPASVPHMWLLLLWIQPALRISPCSKEANTDTILTVLAQQATQSYTVCNCVSNPPVIICLSLVPVLVHSWPNLEFLIFSEIISTLHGITGIVNSVSLSRFKYQKIPLHCVPNYQCSLSISLRSLFTMNSSHSSVNFILLCCIQQFFMSCPIITHVLFS